MTDTRTDPAHRHSASILARNSILNLLGQGAPLIAAIFAIPILIAGLGTDRFGVLTLVWVVIGYFSLFDLGLGRALTQQVAEKLGHGREEDVPPLVWTGLALMALLGAVGALALLGLSPWLVRTVLKIPVDLQQDTIAAFYVMAASIPFVITATGLRGVLEARQQFGLVNLNRAALGVFMFAGPLLVLPFSHDLAPLVAILVGGRIASWLGYLVSCLRAMPSLGRATGLDRGAIPALLNFGAWMTVSNVIGPLMVYLDRFLIGALVSVGAVAYYATPYEVVTKLWIVPGAVASVLFPAIAASIRHNRARAAQLYKWGVKYVFIAVYLPALILVALAQEGLEFWLGREFAWHGAAVMQWLALGVLVNSLAQLPFALIQGAGRPDLTAKFHLIELPFYLAGGWWLIQQYGIEGAAVAWVIRAAVDAAALFYAAERLLGVGGADYGKLAACAALGAAGLAAGLALHGLGAKLVLLLVLIPGFYWLAWGWMMGPTERGFVRNFLRPGKGGAA